MKIRFLADADLNHDVVKGVLRCEPGIDFRTGTGREQVTAVSPFLNAGSSWPEG